MNKELQRQFEMEVSKSSDHTITKTDVGVKTATFAYVEWLEEKAKNQIPYQGLLDLRQELFRSMPTGDVKAWDLILVIKDHMNKLDVFLDKLQPPTPDAIEIARNEGYAAGWQDGADPVASMR